MIDTLRNSLNAQYRTDVTWTSIDPILDALRNLALSCKGQNRRLLIGRDLMPELRKMRLATGATLVTDDWETILGIPFDLVPGCRIGITCDAV